MHNPDWVKQFPGSITVCDRDGKILDLNERAVLAYAADGGERLVGQNVLDCHPELARQKLSDLLASGCPNIYTIEKHGLKKLIYQSPWFVDGQYAGFVELALEIPGEMPHFIRS